MYVPEVFAERDPARLRDFLDAHPLATLIGGGDPPALAHVPLRLD
ncbi:MAG: FMN-binding negative transcriptional regulator, partial [Myxococcales bacterium]